MVRKKINFALRKAYGIKGYTAKEIAEKAGIDYFRFKRLENGQLQKWRPTEKRKLSLILRVPQKILFEG